MVELNQLGFAGPLTSKTMLTVSKNAFKGYLLVYVAYYYMLQGFSTDASERHRSIICCIIVSPFLKIGATFAHRQSSGTVEVFNAFGRNLNIRHFGMWAGLKGAGVHTRLM